MTHPVRHPDELDHERHDPEMLTMAEVATLLRIPIATLRYWRHKGEGPRAFRMGRSVRYWRTEVDAWLQRLTDDPQIRR